MIELRSEAVGHDEPEPPGTVDDQAWMQWRASYGCMVVMAVAPVAVGIWAGVKYPAPDWVKLSVIGAIFATALILRKP